MNFLLALSLLLYFSFVKLFGNDAGGSGFGFWTFVLAAIALRCNAVGLRGGLIRRSESPVFY